MSTLKLTRRYRFSRSHRLDTPALSPEENRRLYGKCNNPYGHGHDYVLDVTVEGRPGCHPARWLNRARAGRAGRTKESCSGWIIRI